MLASQREALWKRITEIIDAGALCGCNIICLQEAWSKLVYDCFQHWCPWRGCAVKGYLVYFVVYNNI